VSLRAARFNLFDAGRRNFRNHRRATGNARQSYSMPVFLKSSMLFGRSRSPLFPLCSEVTMHPDESELYQCEHCGRVFAGALFDISRAMEKSGFHHFYPVGNDRRGGRHCEFLLDKLSPRCPKLRHGASRRAGSPLRHWSSRGLREMWQPRQHGCFSPYLYGE
jgi:hypothetical protein